MFWSAFFLVASLPSFCGVDTVMPYVVSCAKLTPRSHIKSTFVEFS